jgi:hypothetical protein
MIFYKLLPLEDEEPLFYLYDSHTTFDNAFHFLVERRNISSNFIYVQFYTTYLGTSYLIFHFYD